MSSTLFDTLLEPLFLTGGIASFVALCVIWCCEVRAEKRGDALRFDRVRRLNVVVPRARVRIGAEPLFDLPALAAGYTFSPKFLIGYALSCEPLSILPTTTGWLCVLFNEAGLGLEIIAGGLVLRAIIDLYRIPQTWSTDDKTANIAVKSLWCLASGVYLASVTYLAIAVVFALLIVVAFFAAALSNRRRSGRR